MNSRYDFLKRAQELARDPSELRRKERKERIKSILVHILENTALGAAMGSVGGASYNAGLMDAGRSDTGLKYPMKGALIGAGIGALTGVVPPYR